MPVAKVLACASQTSQVHRLDPPSSCVPACEDRQDYRHQEFSTSETLPGQIARLNIKIASRKGAQSPLYYYVAHSMQRLSAPGNTAQKFALC